MKIDEAIPPLPGSSSEKEDKSNDAVLKAIAALSAKFDTLATKEDLSNLRQDLGVEMESKIQSAGGQWPSKTASWMQYRAWWQSVFSAQGSSPLGARMGRVTLLGS